MKTVSVLIPAYNAARFIGRTIESALAQTYPQVEVIVVDDCSTDETAAVVARYPVKLIKHWRNQGQSAAFNTAIAHASGEFVALLDADDLWSPIKLQRCVEELDRNPGALLVYTNGAAIDDQDQPKWDLLPPGHQAPSPADLLINNVIDCPAQVVVRRRELEYFTIGMQSNDHDMWLRLRERGPFLYLDEPLSFYRKHGSQISLRRRQWEDGFTILSAARKRFPYKNSVARRRLAVIHFRLGQWDMRNGKRVRGLWHWTVAGILDPVRALRVAIGRERAS
jgi:glycosyltransferase involved in cell wall biosynthesis